MVYNLKIQSLFQYSSSGRPDDFLKKKMSSGASNVKRGRRHGSTVVWSMVIDKVIALMMN